jgi:hypothetical protein
MFASVFRSVGPRVAPLWGYDPGGDELYIQPSLPSFSLADAGGDHRPPESLQVAGP